MSKKTLVILGTIAVILSFIIFALLLFKFINHNNNDVETVISGADINVAKHKEFVDLSRKNSFIEYYIPKPIKLVYMTNKEKEKFGLAINGAKVQVLKKNEDGDILAYKVIRKPSDIIKIY